MNRLLWDRVDADVAAMAPALRGSLLSWWELHGPRELDQKPWMVTGAGRWPESGEAIDCFGVLVAEVMLQQTQLAVVLPYWRRWMAAFPDLEALAAAAIPLVGDAKTGISPLSPKRILGVNYRIALLVHNKIDLVGAFWPASMGQVVYLGRGQAREDDVVEAPLESNHKVHQPQTSLNGSGFSPGQEH
jgi:A/G-specific adenine glycosylase